MQNLNDNPALANRLKRVAIEWISSEHPLDKKENATDDDYGAWFDEYIDCEEWSVDGLTIVEAHEHDLLCNLLNEFYTLAQEVYERTRNLA